MIVNIIDKIIAALKTVETQLYIYVGIDPQNPPSNYPHACIYSVKTDWTPPMQTHEISLGVSIRDDTTATIINGDKIGTKYKAFEDIFILSAAVKQAILNSKGFIEPKFILEQMDDLELFPVVSLVLILTVKEPISARSGTYI